MAPFSPPTDSRSSAPFDDMEPAPRLDELRSSGFSSTGFKASAADASIMEVVEYLRHGLAAGRPWADILLEAVGLWSVPEERHRGRKFTYLVQGEAFDWVLLAERLLLEVSDDVPHEEKAHLLFYGGLPRPVTTSQFQEALGEAKYCAHLNFFYGVVVEGALMQAVEEEVLKEWRVRGLAHMRGVDDTVAHRLYGDNHEVLLRRFYRQWGRRFRQSLTLGDWNAFTYWLFKLRIEHSDQSRLASDTHKGLRQLEALGRDHQLTPSLVSIPA